MKHVLLLLFCSILWTTTLLAQLPNGSTAPDFTVTDLNNNTWNLYTLLDQGKTVYIDVFATWCGPCWNYKNTGALETIWDTYGPTGTNEAFVIAIEADGSTNIACLYGPSGCVGGTIGDWVTGTNHPIADDPAFNNLYNINYFPTIYMICPDKKVYEVGQLSAPALWQRRTQYCAPPPLVLEVNSVTNVRCYNTFTGAVNISVSGGIAPYSYQWSNNASTQDISNLQAGDYTCTVTSSTGATAVIGPVTVEGPSAPLTVELLEAAQVGCNGILGYLTVGASGGWPNNYNYVWNNGQNGETAGGLNVGNYTVTVTDDGNCTKTFSASVTQATNPQSIIATPPILTCTNTSAQLNGSNSTSGDDITYQWYATNGGNIVTGANTTTPTINAAGTYQLIVLNTATGCQGVSSKIVTANQTPPNANAGPSVNLNCSQNSAVLQGSGSSGANFSYAWTASSGGTILSGGNTLTPTVGSAGTYTLQVNDAANGCTQTSATAVTGTPPPTVSTSGGGLTCAVVNVTLNTSTNASNPGFAWTGPNGYTSSLQSPVVNTSGTYNLIVTDSVTGCTKTAEAVVTANTSAPGAGASASGAITCVVNNVSLSGTSPDTLAAFAWDGPNGFTSTLQNPTVNASGVYNLVVTNAANGCTSSASATVALNNAQPNASAAAPGNLNCNAAQLQLSGAGSAQGANISYLWTTANGHIVSGAETLTPVVDEPGVYSLQVINGDNGCTNTAGTTVVESAPVSAGISNQSNVGCFGAANGSATAVPGGGNGSYAFAWSNGANTATLSNVNAGVYVVVVTDGENCTASNSVTITQPDALQANATAAAQSANGINDGSATASPSGGTASYTYLWNTGASTQTITGLAPGTYTVSVSDANNCTAVQTVTVNAFNCTLGASISSGNISCHGANNGAAAVSLSGQAEPVVYTWSNGANTAAVTNLAPGDYTVSITDGNNCPALLNVTISEPPVLQANATATNESAAGANDGTASANASGGAGSFTYMWNNGANTVFIAGLAPGTYTVVVTDANGCTAQQTVNVNPFNCAVGAQSIISNVSCAGAANGSATITPVGGTAPYNYLWSNGATTATISNLSGGSFTATITDANNCVLVQNASVNEPAPYSNFVVNTTNPICPNDPSGSATAGIEGGTAPYTFQWSNGAIGQTVSNLAPGTYTVNVLDQNNCPSSQTIQIVSTDQEAPSLSVQDGTVLLDANGQAVVTMGALSATANDNCAVVSTVISPASFDCSQIGQHTVSVTATDASGNTTVVSALVTVADEMSPTLDCPADMLVCPTENTVVYAAPVAQDNCDLNGGTWNLESGLPSGSQFPVGATVQTYSFVDASGNKGVCSFTVTVTPPVLFTDIDVINDVNNAGTGGVNVALNGGVEPLSFVWTSQGQVVGLSQNLSGLSAGEYTLVITDAAGCTYSLVNVRVDNTVNAKEPVWLNGVRLQPNPTQGLTRIVFLQMPDEALDITVFDVTGRAVVRELAKGQYVVNLDCSNLPEGVYTIQFRTGVEVGVRKLVVQR